MMINLLKGDGQHAALAIIQTECTIVNVQILRYTDRCDSSLL